MLEQQIKKLTSAALAKLINLCEAELMERRIAHWISEHPDAIEHSRDVMSTPHIADVRALDIYDLKFDG